MLLPKWSAHVVLHTLRGQDGDSPYSRVTVDGGDYTYGTTTGGGARESGPGSSMGLVPTASWRSMLAAACTEPVQTARCRKSTAQCGRSRRG